MMTYSPTYYVQWRSSTSRLYLMHRALELARRMRAKGHTVRVGKVSRSRHPFGY